MDQFRAQSPGLRDLIVELDDLAASEASGLVAPGFRHEVAAAAKAATGRCC